MLQQGASHLKEVMLRIFIVVKNSSLSAGFEATNLRSIGNHDNY
jgi:hypothetical protein